MKKPIALVALVAAYGAGAVAVSAQQSTPQPHRGSAETGLIGIALYDTGAKVVSKYGSPDEIQALNLGGGGNTAGGGGGGAAGGSGGGPGGNGRQGAASATALESTGELIGNPWDENFWQSLPPRGGQGGGGQAAAAAADGQDGGGPGNRAAGAGGGTATGGQNQETIYTRWVYKKNGSKHAFVFDKFNRVVQIESIGLSNKSVKTKRGITFGSPFSAVIKAYNAPDGYEVNGDNIVTKFLVRDRVAFRLSKLKANSKHVVTGIVIAAGK